MNVMDNLFSCPDPSKKTKRWITRKYTKYTKSVYKAMLLFRANTKPDAHTIPVWLQGCQWYSDKKVKKQSGKKRWLFRQQSVNDDETRHALRRRARRFFQLQHFCRITETPFAVVAGESLGTCGAHAWVKQRHMRKWCVAHVGLWVEQTNAVSQEPSEAWAGSLAGPAPTSGVLLLHFAALTRRIWTSRGSGFNDRSASVFSTLCGWVVLMALGRDGALMYAAVNGCFNGTTNTFLFAIPGKNQIRPCYVFIQRFFFFFFAGLFAQRRRLVL